MYLCDLAAQHNMDYKGSSVKTTDGVTTVDSSKLRDGMDTLLTWMHNGNTMDYLINKKAIPADIRKKLGI